MTRPAARVLATSHALSSGAHRANDPPPRRPHRPLGLRERGERAHVDDLAGIEPQPPGTARAAVPGWS
ncbi:hypothetical protein GA0115252_13679, partial [Streptomyces sp. DfronAA-171]